MLITLPTSTDLPVRQNYNCHRRYWRHPNTTGGHHDHPTRLQRLQQHTPTMKPPHLQAHSHSNFGYFSNLRWHRRQVASSRRPVIVLSTITTMMIIKHLIIVVNLLISQPIQCDTSQQMQPQPLPQLLPQLLIQQQQQLDKNTIKSTVRQLIKTTSNYLHHMKLANQQEKNVS